MRESCYLVTAKITFLQNSVAVYWFCCLVLKLLSDKSGVADDFFKRFTTLTIVLHI